MSGQQPRLDVCRDTHPVVAVHTHQPAGIREALRVPGKHVASAGGRVHGVARGQVQQGARDLAGFAGRGERF